MYILMTFLNAGTGAKKGTATSNKRYHTKDVLKHLDMKGCNHAYKPDEGPTLSLYQSKVNMLDEEEKKLYQPITSAVMYLGQFSATTSSSPLIS